MEDIRALNRRLVAASYASDGAYYRWALRSGVRSEERRVGKECM